jgi:hypothetical protein
VVGVLAGAGADCGLHVLPPLQYGSAILALGTLRSRPAGGEPGTALTYAHVWVFEGAAVRDLRQYAAWLPRAEPHHQGRAAAEGLT